MACMHPQQEGRAALPFAKNITPYRQATAWSPTKTQPVFLAQQTANAQKASKCKLQPGYLRMTHVHPMERRQHSGVMARNRVTPRNRCCSSRLLQLGLDGLDEAGGGAGPANVRRLHRV